MIQPNELRIGNYVYLQKSKTPYRITEITQSELEYYRYEATGVSDNSVFHTFTDNLNPIPLTRKTLTACGFTEVMSRSNVYRLELISIRIEKIRDTRIVQFTMFNEDDSILSREIYSLHQLQNLYFALTDKELEVML